MRFLFTCIFLGILMGICAHSSAQDKNAAIAGKVTTENHTDPEGTSVILLAAADSSILKSTICDKSGSFKFENVEPGNYLVIASKIGFAQSLAGPYVISAGGDMNISITLIRSYPQLKEVAVSAKRPYIEVKPGKVVLNVQSSIIAEGNSAFEILRQAPGVHVDNQGNISIIGRQNALIMVDGKPTNLTSENLLAFLQGMQSGGIQQIELITNPSAKYEAAAAGIINIVSRKGTNVGTNGTLTVGGGYGAFYKSNAGLVFNNRTDQFNVFGTYSYAGEETFHSIITDRQINYNNVFSNYDADYYATQKKYSHNFRFGTDYFVSKNSTLGFLVYGSINDNDFIKTNKLNIANNGVKDSLIATDSKLTRNISNINYDLNYNGTLDNSGKTLSVDLLYNDVNRHSDEYITNDFYNATGNNYRPSLYQQNLSPSIIHNWVAKIDYVNPMSKTSKLEAGVKYSWAKSNNDLIFGPLVNGRYQSDPNFSNRFIFTENINSGYLNYTNNLTKWNLLFGLRVEETNSSGNSVTLNQVINRSYLNFFPKIQIVYHFDEKNDFTLGYNRGIERPMYSDINPFLYYIDLYDYRSGNPNLLPEYANNIELSHTYNYTLITTLYAHITTGFYGFNDFDQNDKTKVDITTKKNFGTQSAYGLKFSAPVDFTNWWHANFSLDVAYERTKAYPQNGNLNKGTQDIQFSSMQSFTITNTLSAELSGVYDSPSFYGIAQFKAYYRIDAGIAKQLFDKKASIKLSVNDLFDTWRDRAYSNYQNLNLNIVDKIESRYVKLNFVYRFGKSSVKSVKHQAANEEEQKRIGAGNN
ncbi:MAG: TonB-dependent receptor domain-containing protein [Mucilaginibacter sp.]